MSKRIFVVEDHRIFRDLLIGSLKEIEGVEVCGFSDSAEMALESLPEAKADLAIVDVSLPKMSGFDLAMEIKRRCPELHCLMLSGHRTKGVVETARGLGLDGYVVKGDAAQFKMALQNIMEGKKYFPELTE